MAARITKSLETLRAQVNALAPKRSKASDGWLGDAKHSMRKSDHNPEPDATVDALDLTHDPKNGVDIQKICDAIIASKDRRVSYLICNGKIIAGNGGPQPWVKRVYKGPNKHTKHLHVSVLDAHQDDTAPWKIDAAFGKAASVKADQPTRPAPAANPRAETDFPQPGAKDDEQVAQVQRRLKEQGYVEVGNVDGDFGAFTEKAILLFQHDAGLPLTNAIDEALIVALTKAKPRPVPEARENASPAEVREKVPQARDSWWSKVLAFWGMVATFVTAAVQFVIS